MANQFYSKYDGSPLPPRNIAQNVLASFAVPTDRTSDVYDLLIENARHVGFLKTIKDKEYIDIGSPLNGGAPASGASTPVTSPEEDTYTDDGADVDDFTPPEVPAQQPPATPSAPEKRKRPNKLFVGHGRNKKPLEQLTKILRDLGIPQGLGKVGW